MNTRDENEAETDQWQMPVTAELPGFRPEEMAACPACGRRNAPNRPRCMYCAAELVVSPDTNLLISDRLPEEWEDCFNLVITALPAEMPQAAFDGDAIISDALTLSRQEFVPIPVRRIETSAEAEFLQRQLEIAGYSGKVVADVALALTAPPIRIRGLDLADNKIRLITFNTGETIEVTVLFLVIGSVMTFRTETLERRKRGSAEVLDETATESREAVIDIYPAGDLRGYRILERGFDFTCLGNEMEMVASKNVARLKERLIRIAGDNAVDTYYDEMREVLDRVWPPELRRESLGMMRSGFARKDLGKSQTSSNLEQFTRYSRMRSYLR